jgi:hypothetical protein
MRVVRCDSYTDSASGMRAMMEGVCGACPACSFGFFPISLLAEFFLLPKNSTQSCCSLQSSLHVFFLIDLARQRVRLGLRKMIAYSERSSALCDSRCRWCCAWRHWCWPGGRWGAVRGLAWRCGRSDVAGGGGSAYSPAYRDAEAVGIEHTVLVHSLPVQW